MTYTVVLCCLLMPCRCHTAASELTCGWSTCCIQSQAVSAGPTFFCCWVFEVRRLCKMAAMHQNTAQSNITTTWCQVKSLRPGQHASTTPPIRQQYASNTPALRHQHPSTRAACIHALPVMAMLMKPQRICMLGQSWQCHESLSLIGLHLHCCR